MSNTVFVFLTLSRNVWYKQSISQHSNKTYQMLVQLLPASLLFTFQGYEFRVPWIYRISLEFWDAYFLVNHTNHIYHRSLVEEMTFIIFCEPWIRLMTSSVSKDQMETYHKTVAQQSSLPSECILFVALRTAHTRCHTHTWRWFLGRCRCWTGLP